jgi:hypothetical protein
VAREIAETKLEHAKAARVWLLSLAERIDEFSQSELATRVRELARLVVADAREIVSHAQDGPFSVDPSPDTTQNVEQYDSWVVQVINRHLATLMKIHRARTVDRLTLPQVSEADLGPALAIQRATRTLER